MYFRQRIKQKNKKKKKGGAGKENKKRKALTRREEKKKEALKLKEKEGWNRERCDAEAEQRGLSK